LLDDGETTAPARVAAVSPGVIRLVIHEGRNRQVRRMCEAVGHPVVRLIRTKIGPITDRSLPPGAWRPLEASEVRALAEAALRSGVRAVGRLPAHGSGPAGSPGRDNPR
jgi:23S rRNA pseudouridine2605 synthase